MSLTAFIKSLYVEQPVADETLWHKRLSAPWFATTIDGELISGTSQIWRRKHNGQWQYKQDLPTPEEVADAFF
jgi:hypothetical protein